MKSFLDKLQPSEEELHYKSFLMTFTKFWRAPLNSCFEEIVNKRKGEWKESQLIQHIGILSCGFIYSSVKRAYCSSQSDPGYKK